MAACRFARPILTSADIGESIAADALICGDETTVPSRQSLRVEDPSRRLSRGCHHRPDHEWHAAEARDHGTSR